MTTKQLRAALREHRLANRLSFEALAVDMADVLGADRTISERTLYNFFDGSTEPLELTTYAIQEYLKAKGVAA